MPRLRPLQKALAVHREAAYRRALSRAGWLPRSIDLMVERDRRWIERAGR